MLAAAGIGAILAPPAMGAAAFLIAEFLNISFLAGHDDGGNPGSAVLRVHPLMIEAESRRLRTRTVEVEPGTLGRLTRRYGYHFISLFSLAFFMIRGMTAVRAVFWATLLAIGLSFIRSGDRAVAEAPGRRARRRRPERRAGRGHHRRGRHHRRRRDADRARPEGLGRHRHAGRRQPAR